MKLSTTIVATISALIVISVVGYTGFAFGKESSHDDAISFDMATTTYAGGHVLCTTGTKCIYDITVSGSNTFLACQTQSSSNPRNVTMTYADAPMTELGTQQIIGNPAVWTDTFYLAGAKTGTHKLVIKSTDTDSGFLTRCSSYTGVDQKKPIDVYEQHVVAAASSDSFSITTTAPYAWVVGFWTSAYGTGPTPGADTLKRVEIPTGDGFIFESARNPITTPSTVVLNSTFNRTDDEAATIFAIRPKKWSFRDLWGQFGF